MDHWRSQIPKNNPPKQFCERSFDLGDRKWQQDELELGFELVGDFCGRKKECVVAGISGGEPPWAHEVGGAPRGVGMPWTLVARCLLPLVCSQCQIFSNILEKIIFKFQGIWRTFIFGVFFCARIIQKIDRKYYFALFKLDNRK